VWLVEEKLAMKRSLGEASEEEEWFQQNVRTCDGEPPRFWDGFNNRGKPSFMTNVVHMSWHITRAGWNTSCLVEGKTCDQMYHLVSKHGSVEAAFAAACEARRNVVDTASSVPSRVLVDPKSKTLVVDKCTQNCCKRTNVSIVHFAPDPSATLDKFERFVMAMVIAGNADATHEERQEAVVTMEMLRTQQCFHCRELQNRSHNTGEHNLHAACKAMAEEIRAHLAKRACVKCGQYCGRAMQCEHVVRMGKLGNVLSPQEWATPERGPDSMWNEYKTKTAELQFLSLPSRHTRKVPRSRLDVNAHHDRERETGQVRTRVQGTKRQDQRRLEGRQVLLLL
tara:strand:+ start:651 stop:1664 length:1014 start_codon:yes stop_codon:yes gene_type:complete